MDQLHRDTRRVLLEARNQLEALEAASGNLDLDPAASAVVADAFRDNVALLARHAAALRAALPAEPPARRDVWRARLRDLDVHVAELRAGHARCADRFRRIEQGNRMRAELLQRRPAAHSAAAPAAHGPGDAVLRMGLADEARTLDRSKSVVGNILGTGRGALHALVEQRVRLRGAKTKMLDVMNQIGVDRKIIASIERREWSDTMLAYGLMLLMVVLLGLAVVWKYHRKARAGV